MLMYANGYYLCIYNGAKQLVRCDGPFVERLECDKLASVIQRFGLLRESWVLKVVHISNSTSDVEVNIGGDALALCKRLFKNCDISD